MGKKADKEHPYGHERFESLFALVLAAVILFTAIELIRSNVATLISYFQGSITLVQPNYWALIGGSVALIIKLFIYLKTRRMAKLYHSTLLKADELNHFGDIFFNTWWDCCYCWVDAWSPLFRCDWFQF